ncbi:MAG TPA: hypothetical protein VF459_12760 [Caulobacteraceae bacterium]
MSQAREKFATQVDPALLADLRGLAKSEGRQLQSVVEEAFATLIELRRSAQPRRHVMEAYRSSLARFGPLYEKLAK